MGSFFSSPPSPPPPTPSPTPRPTFNPTKRPTLEPTLPPTPFPTFTPTVSPTGRPTDNPTKGPTRLPTVRPTQNPTNSPTPQPTPDPTPLPTTAAPVITASPTLPPTSPPTLSPTKAPTKSPTKSPTAPPTLSPTLPPPTTPPTVPPTLSPTTPPTLRPTKSPTLSPTVSPTSEVPLGYSYRFTFCANENEFCAFQGTRTVRYGADGQFFIDTFTGGTPCTNDVFGDPIPGTFKSCELQSEEPLPATFSFCANENEFCSFEGPGMVRYGANDQFFEEMFTGGVSCSNDVFGDPIPEVFKSCEVALIELPPTANPTLAPTKRPTPSPTSAPTKRPTITLTFPPTGSPSEVVQTPPPTPTPTLPFGRQGSCQFVDDSRFNICLDLQVPADRRAIYLEAKADWEAVNVGHQGVFNIGSGAYDDMLMTAVEEFIDGPRGILGSAGPTFIASATGLSVAGNMRFDTADVQRQLDGDGPSFFDTVRHEMGHILGIGTLWNLDSNGFYLEEKAQILWEDLGCNGAVPIERGGGDGTALGHFDEECLRTELMTGFLSRGVPNELTEFSIAALEDLGWTVDYTQAEPLGSISSSCCLDPSNFLGNSRRLRGPRELGFFEDFFNEASDRVQDFVEDLVDDISDELKKRGAKVARDAMKRIREEFANFELPEDDDIIFIGGDVVTVFFYDDDGNIRDKKYTWDEVKDADEGESALFDNIFEPNN